MEQDFLRKFEVSYPVAIMIIFGCGYLSATITTLFMTNTFIDIMTDFLTVVIAVIIYITAVFVVAQYIVKRLDIVDVAWGGGFIVATVASFLIGQHALGWNEQTLVSVLVLIWGLRLGYFILRRVSAHAEDKRYVELRRQWKGNSALNAYLRIFLIQGILATIISIAVIHINLSDTSAIGVFGYVGLAVWIVGFLFEAIGDAQLKKFLGNQKNKGKLMTSGLWKYTRHPNYFGESTMWWGIFVIVLGTPYGWVGIVTPVVITYLLRFVSGVPMTEKHFEGRKGWKSYKKQTNIFVPLLPKQ